MVRVWRNIHENIIYKVLHFKKVLSNKRPIESSSLITLVAFYTHKLVKEQTSSEIPTSFSFLKIVLLKKKKFIRKQGVLQA